MSNVALGQKFGEWEVIAFAKPRNKIAYVTCKCGCGKESDIRKHSLITNKSKSCVKCASKFKKKFPKEGDVFNSLTIISYSRTEHRGSYAIFKVRCVCGTEKEVALSHMKSGKTKSCGCHKIKVILQKALVRRQNPDNFKDVRQKADMFTTKRAYLRDNFTCLLCGQRGGNLNAHHIVRWVDNKELRFDLTNIATLCLSCHFKAHDGNYVSGINLEIQNKLKSIVLNQQEES